MKEAVFPRLKKRVLYFATHYTWAFVMVMAVTVLSCVFSIHYLASLEANLNEVYENDVRGGDAVQAAFTALLGIESTVKDLVLYPAPESRDQTKSQLRDLAATLKGALTRGAPRFHTPRARQVMLTALVDQKSFLGALDRVLAAADGRKPLTAADLTEVTQREDVLERDFDALLANRTANSTIGIADLVFQLRLSLVLTVVLLVVTVVIRVILYWAGHPSRKKPRGGPG